MKKKADYLLLGLMFLIYVGNVNLLGQDSTTTDSLEMARQTQVEKSSKVIVYRFKSKDGKGPVIKCFYEEDRQKLRSDSTLIELRPKDRGRFWNDFSKVWDFTKEFTEWFFNVFKKEKD